MRDDFELFLVQLGGQHRLSGTIHRLAELAMETQQIRRQGQGTAVVGIYDQEFFLDTKSTHLISVLDERDSQRHAWRSPHPKWVSHPIGVTSSEVLNEQ